MNGSDSGQANGTLGTQTSLEQGVLEQVSSENERLLHDEYLKNILPNSSPLRIPRNAKITEEKKTGYSQVKYQWNRGEYEYIGRWHTKTPGAPINQGDSWVIERRKPGIGYGPNARKAIREVLVGKYKWVSKAEWNNAIHARKTGTITKKQREMLDNGHWKV